MDDTSYPDPVLTKLASPQVVSGAPEAVFFEVASAHPIWLSDWKATACFPPLARVKLRAGVVSAMQEPKLASITPAEVLAALFQIT